MAKEPRTFGSSKSLQTQLIRARLFTQDPLLSILGSKRWDKLSPRQKLVFKLSIVGDFTDDEIALKLGIKKTTVKETARKGAGKLNLYRRDIQRLYIDEMRKMLNELSKFG